DVQVRKSIDQIDCALGGIGVETIPKEGRRPTREDRGTRVAIAPGDGHPLLIEPSRQPIEPIRPIHIVLDVFLAGPNDLDRTVDLLGDFDSTRDAVAFQPTAKTTAD